ncbi:high mobility group B protein 7 isoform X2 [Vitis riparia]|uniref:high mobility group B protein 7 isoform X2 n=1 Tax=Vitis riparia TaxID=96939 RepID=UPI00155A09C6|nr:high mobility group B protein 7 isoform X2 [Vitis riparia]
MANPPITRKRVHAIASGIRRGPNGSAFEKCHGCGVSVAIALADMHDCGLKRDVKRFKGQREVQILRKQTCLGEPRSPFRLFMENFRKASKTGNPIDVDRIGFEAWKKMSMEVDDEADSAMVGKFDKFYGFYEDSEDSDSFQSFRSKTIESFNTFTWGPY